jgi:hypothetical protein
VGADDFSREQIGRNVKLTSVVYGPSDEVSNVWSFISASLNVFMAWLFGIGTALFFLRVRVEKLQKFAYYRRLDCLSFRNV